MNTLMAELANGSSIVITSVPGNCKGELVRKSGNDRVFYGKTILNLVHTMERKLSNEAAATAGRGMVSGSDGH